MALKIDNLKMTGKLAVIVLGMFAFGYALVPIYRAICEATGINILALGEKEIPGAKKSVPTNTQVDTSRLITVEFDANVRGPWDFKPEKRSLQVHPSYAPKQASPHFNKLECFCFQQYTLEPGEKKNWPVAFVIDPRLPKDVTTITLSYTFFEVGGKTPPAPSSNTSALAPVQQPLAAPVLRMGV
jgi:cytochrome c oxidase assembly protein subunit 11